MSGYTTREVADLIGFKPDQVRHYVRRRLVAPGRGLHGEYRFGFQDVVLLRTARGLLDAQVGARRAHRLLQKLRRELAHVDSLASVRIFADGNNVVVRDNNRLWEVETGQGHLDFAVRELADNVATLALDRIVDETVREGLDSDDWYNLGLDLEEVDADKAPEAYLRAIELDPRNADAHVNLGRLYQLSGDLKRAKRHYQLALAAAPTHQLAHYNLGTVFDELDEMQQAAEYYRKAPTVPDAHYNLARIFELSGDEVSALRHLRQYQKLLDAEG